MRIVTLMLRYDYGVPERGISLEYFNFYEPLTKLGQVFPFWLEDNGFPNNTDGLQVAIKEFCNIHKPHLVFTCLMNDEIRPETFDYLKKFTNVYNWFADDMWRLPWSLEVAKHLRGVLTVDKYSIDAYEKQGTRAVLTQWASNEYAERLNTVYETDVTFIGGASQKRWDFIKPLLEAGVRMQIYGNGWENGRLDRERIPHVMQAGKICLNLSNSEGNKHCEQIKARTFEIPAMGGFQLSHYALEVEDYFDIGKEIAVYATKEDLFKQVMYYLNHDKEREEIRKRGWKRAKEYTYANRWKKILKELA